jgi:protein kinase-like protein/PEGA domain-containing protein
MQACGNGRWCRSGSAAILRPVTAEHAGQRYDLLEPIAAGGMGEVFVGRVRGEHGFLKLVAIKRILPELARNPEFMVRFVAEAKLAVSLSHANIVQVFDLGRSGDDLLLVMEYIRGTDLGQLLARLADKKQQLSVAVAVYMAMEALKGLVHAHERREPDGRGGVIHCDLSPSNLLVSWAGEVKLVDFGVAQALDVARRRRATGSVMGKLRYLAPEQLLGKPLDARTDLYSLAVVLHEALTSQHPFDAGLADAIASAVVAGGAPPVSRWRPDVPEALDQLVARAMSRRPSDRPESARAMLTELTRIAQKLDPVTPPDVGGWARACVDETPLDAMPRWTPTVSAVPAGKATVTFVVRTSIDGVTVLDKESAARRRGRRLPVAAGLLLGVTLFAAGSMARRLGSPATAAPPVTVTAAMTQPIIVTAPAPPAPTPALHGRAAAPAPPNLIARADPPPRSRPQPPRPARTALAPLASPPGYVNIYADPWASVSVDGKLLGSTPLPRVPLAAGVHRVRLENPKARPVERLVRIESGKTELLDVDLDPRP